MCESCGGMSCLGPDHSDAETCLNALKVQRNDAMRPAPLCSLLEG